MSLKFSLIILYIIITTSTARASKSNTSFFVDTDVSYTHEYDDKESSQIKNNKSTAGLKGYFIFSDRFKVFYKSEWKIKDENFKLSGLTSRTNYIGINTPIGNWAVGKNESLLQRSFTPIDLFNKHEGDIGELWEGENEINKSLSYYSQHIKGFSTAVMYSKEDNYKSASLQWGDNRLISSNTFASYTLTKNSSHTIQRLAAIRRLYKATTYVAAQQQSYLTRKTGVLFGLKYPIKNVIIKGQYQTLDKDKIISLGVDVHINKKLKLYAWHTTKHNKKAEYKKLSIGASLTF